MNRTMTLLKPGMKASYKLPDGSTYELKVSTEAQPDDAAEAEKSEKE